MSEFSTRKGADLFSSTKPEIKIPRLVVTEDHMKGIKGLFDVARQENPGRKSLPGDVEDWVNTQRQEQQELLGKLCAAGLGDQFSQPGFMVKMQIMRADGEKPDLPLPALLEYMKQEGAISSAEGFENWIKSFRRMQMVEQTSGLLLPDKKLQYRGKSLSDMNKEIEGVDKGVSKATKRQYGARMLGVAAGLQRHAQDPAFRDVLRDLSMYTPDVTAGGGVAGLFDCYGNGQAAAGAWSGGGSTFLGSSSAVVKTIETPIF